MDGYMKIDRQNRLMDINTCIERNVYVQAGTQTDS